MAKGFKHGAGGTDPLQFQVVGGTTAPAAPKENTIWVNTNTEITGWIFSPAKPKSPVSGMVWITTGTSSTVEFNALKKNGIQVCPISAKQYVSKKWVDKTAQSYQGGKWVDWWSATYLFKSGEGEIVEFSQATENNSSIDVSKECVSISRSNTVAETSCYMTADTIDLTEFSTLYARVQISDLGAETNRRPALGVGSSPARASANTTAFFDGAYTMFTVSNNKDVVEVDVSDLNSDYYVGINGAMIGDFFDIWLE